MDLDQLIRDADPARELYVPIPDPELIRTSDRQRAFAGVGGLIASALAVGVAVVVAVVALSVGSNRPAPSSVIPNRLPFGTLLRQAGPTDVIARTARIQLSVPDPQSGPAWALRTFKTRSGMTCLQVGRTESGAVGAIGFGGAFHNDGRFHPFTFSDLGLGTCVPNDARGHAFSNIADEGFPANAAAEPCVNPPARVRARAHIPVRNCAEVPVRNIYFGLLGPDATSITYLGSGGRQLNEPTHGADGAYLIVTPVVHAPCPRRALRPCEGNTGSQSNAELYPGEITAVRYRDGHVCRPSEPSSATALPGHSCPAVGYTPPPVHRYTAAQVASPVTVRKLPAHHYCQQPGIYRPAALPIPCDGKVPAGYARIDEGQRSLLIYISWTARAPVTNINQSGYGYAINFPRSPGCGSSVEGNSTQALIQPGQRITRSLYLPTKCRGTYTAQVNYVPNLGPTGPGSMLLGPVTNGPRVLLVGRVTFTLP